jgi:hypothetical protein
MDEQELADNLKILELYKSVEYQVFLHVQRIADAYLKLTNAKVLKLTYAEASDALKEIRAASKDLQSYIFKELNARNITIDDDKNVNDRVLPSLDSHWLNCGHYAQRFCFSNVPGDVIQVPGADGEIINHINLIDYKIQNLTAFAHIVHDLVLIAEATKVEPYFREIAPF